jgi:hypothetical protein
MGDKLREGSQTKSEMASRMGFDIAQLMRISEEGGRT